MSLYTRALFYAFHKSTLGLLPLDLISWRQFENVESQKTETNKANETKLVACQTFSKIDQKVVHGRKSISIRFRNF